MSHPVYPVYRLIDISGDLAVAANHVTAVKNLGDGKCAVFVTGQSATDGGFVVEAEWSELVGEINDELERAAEEAGQYDNDDEEDTDIDADANADEDQEES